MTGGIEEDWFSKHNEMVDIGELGDELDVWGALNNGQTYCMI